VSYVVDGIGEFHSLGAALRAAVVTNDQNLPVFSEKPRLFKALPPPTLPVLPPAPTPPVVVAPAEEGSPLQTAMWIGLGLLAAYAVYTLVTDKDE